MFGTLLLWSSGGLLCLLTSVWILSVFAKDASLADRIWGLTFVVQVLSYFFASGTDSPFAILLLLLVIVWGSRLSLFLHIRNQRHGKEDYRYARMRRYHGDRFWWYSFFSVFLLQGAVSLTVGSPLLLCFANLPSSPLEGFSLLILLCGCALWLVGLAFETVADLQLTAFKADDRNRDKVLRSGLWALTRHPNYFGDALVWWGLFLVSLSSPSPLQWLGALGPVVMTFFLRHVSGVAMLDRDQLKRKPDYARYVAEVPAFVPRPLASP